MTVDRRLISIKDGGRFAMSWLAGTNPKALRSNTHRSHVYTLDVPEVCKDIIKCIKQKNNSISFRILFRLCFGTIKIYSEQVQHLYNVTVNFVCFNTFFLKQYSRKRTSSAAGKNDSKRRRKGSTESVDITSLLMESEVFNEYSEENFEFPQGASTSKERNRTSSTCIHIKEITIRQISWDCPQPDEEDAFGEASQDERKMLLNELCDNKEDDLMSEQSSVVQKRKSPNAESEVPEKRFCHDVVLENSLEQVRCAPASIIDESVSEFNVSQCFAEASVVNSQDISDRNMIIEEMHPRQDQCLPQNEHLPESPNVLPVKAHVDIPETSAFVKRHVRKRPRSHLIIDKSTKLPKINLDHCRSNLWENCWNYVNKDHIANKFRSAPVTSFPPGPTRFPKMLGSIKKNFKTAQKQMTDAENRLLLIEEILGDDEAYKSEFKLTAATRSRSSAVDVSTCPEYRHPVEEITMQPVNNETMDLNNNCEKIDECPGESRILENAETLKCSLDKINLSQLKFDFPNDASSQSSRSNWGKEGILRKLLSLWQTTAEHVTMTTLLVGANRINAALAFHTLLDLAGHQYINIMKHANNSIKSITMGREMIRKINKQCR